MYFFTTHMQSFISAQVPNMSAGGHLSKLKASSTVVEPTWQALHSHVNSCKVGGCCCSKLLKNFEAWACRLPLSTSSGAESDLASPTWLWFHFNAVGMLRWRCVACHNNARANRTYTDEQVAENEFQVIQFANLQAHHKTEMHQDAVSEFLGLGPRVHHAVAPDRDLFKQVLREFHKGVAPQGGYQLAAGLVGAEKALKLLWCISEYIFETKRELMRAAVTFNLIRDERNVRMHIRFSVAADSKSKPSSCCSAVGFLGQSRHHKPDAIGIMEATVAVFKTFCTKYANCPVDMVVEPQYLASDFKHMLEILEAITVDSAENEVVSAKDINKLKPEGSKEVIVIRDAAHCIRRVLSRLFRADQVLAYTFDFFAMIAKLIHWSPDLRALYQECTEESLSCAVSTKFQHLRAAKHRIETWLTPLSRSMLDPEGACNVQI